VHPAGREVHGYIHLVRHLGGEQPVFGVQDLGEDLGRPVTRIAAEHVQAIRAVQPEGPYHLMGWSFGGTVAYEMAVELERQGQQVAFVGVLDTAAGGVGDQIWEEIADDELLVGLAGDVAAQMGRPFALPRAELHGLTLDAQLRRAVEALHAQQAAPEGYEPEMLHASYRVVHERTLSRRGYVPGRFSGWMTVFKAAALPASVDPALVAKLRDGWTDEDLRTLCWCRLVDERVEVHEVPGTHVTMGTEPYVRTLAACVRQSLAAAREPRVQVPAIYP
jgi:thioesterase domain-containing protein